MKNLFLLIVFIISLSFISCNKDKNNNDSVIDEPKQEEIIHPNELIGTWIYYSGTPKSVLSDVDSSLILNHVLTLNSNGNFTESIIAKSGINEGSLLYGNWKVNNKTFVFTDWNGNIINNDISYSISKDSVLNLTCGNKSAIYYHPSNLQNMYPTLIIGSWEIYKAFKIVMLSDGTGAVYSNYYDGFYRGREYTTWSLNEDSLLIKYKDWAGPAALNEYTIDFLNTKYLCLKSNNGKSCYSRQ